MKQPPENAPKVQITSGPYAGWVGQIVSDGLTHVSVAIPGAYLNLPDHMFERLPEPRKRGGITYLTTDRG